MIVGVLKEIKTEENRVCMTPARQHVRAGARCVGATTPHAGPRKRTAPHRSAQRARLCGGCAAASTNGCGCDGPAHRRRRPHLPTRQQHTSVPACPQRAPCQPTATVMRQTGSTVGVCARGA